MSKFLDTPVTDIPGNPDKRTGDGDDVYGGEPGWPGRTGGDGLTPEVTYDNLGGQGKTGK